MKPNKSLRIRVVFGTALAASLLIGCAQVKITPAKKPEPPSFVQLPHPATTDAADLAAILASEKAPPPEFVNTCDENIKKLQASTTSKDELAEGIRELVNKNPDYYHWCFYSKMNQLEDELRKTDFVDEKQQKILERYETIVPIARTFLIEFSDSRYLRFAVSKYQKYSQTAFYRKVELTPEGTSELVQPDNPFGLYQKSADSMSVLEKYHIERTPAQEAKFRELPIAQPNTPPETPATTPPAQTPAIPSAAPNTALPQGNIPTGKEGAAAPSVPTTPDVQDPTKQSVNTPTQPAQADQTVASEGQISNKVVDETVNTAPPPPTTLGTGLTPPTTSKVGN